MTRLAFLLVGVLAWGLPVSAQAPSSTPPPVAAGERHSEEGRPFVRSYAPAEVGGGGQFWALVQDKRGVIYAGTNAAVLEFDGASWRRIRLPATAVGRSLAIDATGRIYVGAVHDLGYLAADAKSEMQFVSLRERLPADARAVNVIWRTHVATDGVVFQSETGLYRWANNAFTVVRAASRFHRSSVVDGRVYVPMPETGLNLLEHDRLRPLPGTERLRNEPFLIVLRYDETRLLIGTRSDGLFLYDGTALTPFRTGLDSLLKGGQLYRGIGLPDGTFALATISLGMGVIDRQGRQLAIVNRAAGLQSDVVYFVMRDAEGALWLALDSGLARAETPSPLSFLDQTDGLPGGVFAALRHEGRLYLATQTGIRYLAPATPSKAGPRVEPVRGATVGQCWALTEMPVEGRAIPALLLGCSDGLYEIAGTVATPIKTPTDLTFRVFAVTASRADPSRVWLGGSPGVTSFRHDHGRWVDEGLAVTVSSQVRSIFENADGSLWVGTETDGIVRVRFASRPAPNAPLPAATMEQFGKTQGLPEGGVTVLDVGGVPYFQMGIDAPYIARFDEAAHRFVRDTAFDVAGIDPIAGANTAGLVGGPDGRAYLNLGRETVVLQKGAGGAWTADKQTFSRFGSRMPPALLFPEKDGTTWLQLPDKRLVRYATSRTAVPPHAFAALIRRVTLSGNRVLFGGASAHTTAAAQKLEPSSNALRFEFAAPDFLDESATEYQSMLQGLDDEWSAWTRDARRDYTNLGFGAYRFRVRARNVLGQTSR
jgi:hypothetical protein